MFTYFHFNFSELWNNLYRPQIPCFLFQSSAPEQPTCPDPELCTRTAYFRAENNNCTELRAMYVCHQYTIWLILVHWILFVCLVVDWWIRLLKYKSWCFGSQSVLRLLQSQLPARRHPSGGWGARPSHHPVAPSSAIPSACAAAHSTPPALPLLWWRLLRRLVSHSVFLPCFLFVYWYGFSSATMQVSHLEFNFLLMLSIQHLHPPKKKSILHLTPEQLIVVYQLSTMSFKKEKQSIC